MKFQITILGSGSSLPTLERNPTSQVVNVNENLYMIDCAEGTQVQLRKFKVKFQKINHIFISHLHGDHYLGLIGLIQSMHLLGRKNILNIYGHPTLWEIIKLHNSASDTYLKYPITFHPLSYDEKKLIHEDSKTKVYSLPLKHRIPTCGFLFEEKERDLTISKAMIENYEIPVIAIKDIKKGKDFTTPEGRVIANSHLTEKPIPPRKYAFCSDTMYFEKIVDDIKHFDLLYHEATFLEDLKSRAKETYHSTAIQAATIAKMAEVKQLLLGHFSVRYNENEKFLEQAQSVFSETALAQDGMTINL